MFLKKVFSLGLRFNIIFLIACLFTPLPLEADTLETNFNDNLSLDDKTKLFAGEMVIRACPSVKKMSGLGNEQVMNSVLDDVYSFKPNYIAEVVKIYPFEKNDDFVSKFASMMTNIPAEFTIPYYSSEAKKEMTLSLTYKNLSNSIRGIVTDSVSDFTMSPFGLINTAIHTERSDCTYWYSLTNTNKIKYKDFITCVGKENMKLSLALFKSDDYWVVYGFVAADAPSIFFIRKKVEAAIVERAQAFCSYFFTQLE